MSEKHPGPLVVEGKLTDAERMKLRATTCAAPLRKI
jgi:sulfite reductase (NADPH) hemoprotein beta-component